jgi:formylglycine-generating enzyme required for sulfatase activity
MGTRTRVAKATALAFLLGACVVAGTDEGVVRRTEAPELIAIPAGVFIAGSDRAERDLAYRLDEAAYGHSRTREGRWYDNEESRQDKALPGFRITRMPITNAQYAVFLRASGYPPPEVDRATWESYRLVHPFARTRRHAWVGATPPSGRARHPVVLVSHEDALAYADWLSRETRCLWRLPSGDEWEKAARGTGGAIFPWGDSWDPARLNSHDLGPFDTMPVGSFPAGASPFGLLDAAGQVFEWTNMPGSRPGTYEVRGGSWDDKGCGVCRPAARHDRPSDIKHILIGFRLVAESCL